MAKSSEKSSCIQHLHRAVTAKSLVLDLLRASASRPFPVRTLVDVASIFDISENALRVNLNRLLSKHLIEQDHRGFYRLAPGSSAIHNWVEDWHGGEQRVRPWQGDWLSLHIHPKAHRNTNSQLERSAYRLGFRELWKQFWIRPNNLNKTFEQLHAQIAQLADSQAFALCEDKYLHIGNDPRQLPDTPPFAYLWDSQALEAAYTHHQRLISEAIEHSEDLPLREILRETFLLGGEAIHILAMDPLLPSEYVDVAARNALTELMKSYDKRYRPAWFRALEQTELSRFPGNLEVHL